MAKYRKKPIIVDAWKYNGTFAGCPEWISDAIEKRIIKRERNVHLYKVIVGNQYDIETLEGDMHLSIGDYIIKGVKGELYPCKPDIFENTYEEME